MHHGLANGVSLAVEEASMYLIIVESIEQEDKCHGRVDVDNDETKHSSHK